MRGDGTAGLADDHGMRHVAGVAHALDPVDDVARVFIERVVHRGLEVGAAAVVIDAQAAADVDVLQAGTHDFELGVHMRQFVDGVLHAADILKLAARMAVHELQAIQHAPIFEEGVEIENLADEEAEFGFLAGGFPPAAGALAGQLHAHADLRPHVVALGMFQDQMNFFVVLHDRNDGAAEFGGENDGFDVAVVLEAVAHHDAVRRILGDGHHREQLRLGAHFESEAELLPVAVHLLDHQALLIDLDRKYRGVAILVAVLDDGRAEGFGDVAQAVRENVGEADDHGGVQVAGFEPLHHFVQVDFARRVHAGPGHHVTGFIDRKIAFPPSFHLV